MIEMTKYEGGLPEGELLVFTNYGYFHIHWYNGHWMAEDPRGGGSYIFSTYDHNIQAYCQVSRPTIKG